ncbi:MAG: RNA polymerase sigma factor [Clostridia bacterium]|nr:RNA polymerase sigma factor [Clostridia bacterium]
MTSTEFGERIVEMQETLYRVCYSILPRACDREDVVQECIRIAWQKRSSLRNERYLQTWVVRILIRECYALLRSGKREHLTEAAMEEAFPERIAPPDANIDLHDALVALPASLRLPVTLHYLEGYPLSDIAHMLRLPTGTVKSRLNRARRQLKTSMLDEEMVRI